MTTQLKAKLLQHFAGKKKGNGGFTLIELLVVIIIIGILSAIALPSFLNQANKAKQSEAKTYVGSMNRAQQAYYLEEGKFAGPTDFGALGLGINPKTENYEYTISAIATTPVVGVTNQADPVAKTTASVKAYIGGVELGTTTAGESTTLAVLCEALKAQATGGSDGLKVAAYGGGGTATIPGTNAARCVPTNFKPIN